MQQFRVDSEVGKLRKVLVHRPDLSLRRLTPSNREELLFDDVLWVRKARGEHDKFVRHLEKRGVEVYYLDDLLTEAGYRVFTAARLHDAMGVADRERIDCAILDINLHGEQVYPLCERLEARGVPFFFASAYGSEGIAERYRGVPMVNKPYTCDEVMRAISQRMDDFSGR